MASSIELNGHELKVSHDFGLDRLGLWNERGNKILKIKLPPKIPCTLIPSNLHT